ncbi:MAG: hypothetical protein C4311_07020 [Chloroflexota bacterium]
MEEPLYLEPDFLWFQLFCMSGIGPKRLAAVHRELQRLNLNPETVPLNKPAFAERYPDLARLIFRKGKAGSPEVIGQEYEFLRQQGVSIIHPGHQYYLATLLSDAERFGVSPVLFCKGRIQLFNTSRSLAVVGSRDASDVGLKAAQQLASGLAAKHFNVVSGYTKGVDSETHLGALEAGGTTTMVLSYGILQFKIDHRFSRFDDQNMLIVSQFYPRES